MWFKFNSNLPENSEQLINFWVTMEKRTFGDHFSKYTANTPHVYRSGVALGAEENLWSSVPQCYHLKDISVEIFQIQYMYYYSLLGTHSRVYASFPCSFFWETRLNWMQQLSSYLRSSVIHKHAYMNIKLHNYMCLVSNTAQSDLTGW